MKKTLLTLAAIAFFYTGAKAQSKSWQFAHVSDTHIGSSTSVEDLRRTIKDINANPNLEFVAISGDITEFGSDEELRLAKKLLDSLNKPWYLVPGNHDANWSESGGNTFKMVFGSETFSFTHRGILFLGTNCGPNMRMSPGQVPRENIVWLDSVLKATPKETPVVFMNHYPIDSGLNNWYEIIDRLKMRNTQLVINGHYHTNNLLNYEGIPGIVGRSNLRAKDSIGGYNIVTMTADSVFYQERRPGVLTKKIWARVAMKKHDFSIPGNYPRPSYLVNNRFPGIKETWVLQDKSDVGSGAAVAGDLVITTNTTGWIRGLSAASGKQKWATRVGGKIYGTPNTSEKYVVVSCTDMFIYCLDRNTGKIIWKAKTNKPVVASPLIYNGSVFCGGSDGYFRSYDLRSGKQNWQFEQVKGFVVTKPLIYNGVLYFGSWGNQLYALDHQTGQLKWKWDSPVLNRMFSPAAAFPVATNGRLFVVAPDKFMTCFDTKTGKVLWRKNNPKIKVRESMGLSADSSLIFVKTMDGEVLGMNAKADSMEVSWKGNHVIGYDISPSMVQERDGLVFALSNSGCIYAFNRSDASLAWIHKLSNCLVNPLAFLPGRKLVATTMDGKVSCISY